MKPLISTMIVAYRSEKYINPCIESIRASARFAKLPLEVIVVVNDPANKHYKFPKGVKVIKSKRNIGYSAGINAGARQARGKWLLVANPDTVTDKKALYYLSRHFKVKNIAVVGPKIVHPDGSIQLTINSLPSLWQVFLEQSYLYKIFPFSKLSPKADMRQYTYSHTVEALEATYLLIRKKYFNEVGDMDERFFLYFEDMDLCTKMQNKDYEILFESQAKIMHHGQRSSGSIMYGGDYFSSLMAYFYKYYPQFFSSIAVHLISVGSLIRIIYWYMFIALGGKNEQATFVKKKFVYYKEILQAIYENS